MDPQKIARINELKRISTTRDLTPDELSERDALRREYIDGFRKNMEEVLSGVQIQQADGSVRPLQKKNPKA